MPKVTLNRKPKSQKKFLKLCSSHDPEGISSYAVIKNSSNSEYSVRAKAQLPADLLRANSPRLLEAPAADPDHSSSLLRLHNCRPSSKSAYMPVYPRAVWSISLHKSLLSVKGCLQRAGVTHRQCLPLYGWACSSLLSIPPSSGSISSVQHRGDISQASCSVRLSHLCSSSQHKGNMGNKRSPSFDGMLWRGTQPTFEKKKRG